MSFVMIKVIIIVIIIIIIINKTISVAATQVEPWPLKDYSPTLSLHGHIPIPNSRLSEVTFHLVNLSFGLHIPRRPRGI
jgi:hypothetical protein